MPAVYRPRDLCLTALLAATALVVPQAAHALCPANGAGSVSVAESPAGRQDIGNDASCTVEEGASIVVNAPVARGIDAVTGNTIVNNGLVAVTGNDSTGISVRDVGNTVTNTGTVTASGISANGIFVFNNNTVTNTGTISVSGDFSRGIIADDGNTIVNSGLIHAPDSEAIVFRGAGNSLVLQPGSVIVGQLSFSANNALTVGNGMSLVYTFSNQLPGTINANGAPVVVNGNQVAVLDTTTLSKTDEMIADLSGGIFNSVHARLNGAAGGAPANGFSGFGLGASPSMQLGGGSMMNLSSNDVSPSTSDSRSAFWAQAFGGVRDDAGDATTMASDHRLTGGIGGIDGMVLPGLRLGAFGGGAHADVKTKLNTQDLSNESYFGGLYASMQRRSWFAHVILTAGRSDYETSRVVGNNTVAAGLQTATASFDGTFVSPQVTLGTSFRIGGIEIEPSVRGSYVNLSVDGYSETGAADALSIGEQDISLWQGRAQIALPMRSAAGVFAPRFGVEGWSSDNDTVSAVLIGRAVSFDPGGSSDQITGFFGATASTQLGANVSAFIDGEVHAGDDGFLHSEARAGLTARF